MIYALQGDPTAAPPAGGLGSVFTGTPWIDLVGLGVITLFFALGIKHGLVWQVTRLIGMLVAITLARSLSPEFVPMVESALNLPTKACQGIVWFLVFLGTLLVTAMIGVVGRRALEAVHLGPMDRMGGALAGGEEDVAVARAEGAAAVAHAPARGEVTAQGDGGLEPSLELDRALAVAALVPDELSGAGVQDVGEPCV